MGTTSKGFRYPEGVVVGNTIHTKIKELAQDIDSSLTSRDTRLNGLDTKTDNTNNTLNVRGLPVSRHAGYGVAAANLPNNDAVYTVHSMTNLAIVPSGARTAIVSMHMPGHCVANAQAHWDPLASFGGSGWISMFASGYISVHNQAQPAINMGFSVTSAFDVRPHVGGYFGVALNAFNDTGSGAWVHVGYLNWSVTFQS